MLEEEISFNCDAWASAMSAKFMTHDNIPDKPGNVLSIRRCAVPYNLSSSADVLAKEPAKANITEE